MRELPALVIATLLHGALPLIAAIAPRPDLVHRLEHTRDRRTEIEIDGVLPEVSEHEALPSGEPLAGAPLAVRERRRRAADPLAPAAPGEIGPETPLVPIAPDGPSPDAEPDPSEYDLPPAPIGLPGTGLPGSLPSWATLPQGEHRDRADPNPAPTRVPERQLDRRQGEKVVADAMRKKDRKLGLDLPAASAIGSVVVSAVRASEAPYECRGSLSVTLSPSGKVTHVALLGYSGGGAGVWEGVRAAVHGSLAGRSFTMSSHFPRGAVVTVTAISRIEKPKAIGVEGAGAGVSGSFDVSAVAQRETRIVSPAIQVTAIE